MQIPFFLYVMCATSHVRCIQHDERSIFRKRCSISLIFKRWISRICINSSRAFSFSISCTSSRNFASRTFSSNSWRCNSTSDADSSDASLASAETETEFRDGEFRWVVVSVAGVAEVITKLLPFFWINWTPLLLLCSLIGVYAMYVVLWEVPLPLPLDTAVKWVFFGDSVVSKWLDCGIATKLAAEGVGML